MSETPVKIDLGDTTIFETPHYKEYLFQNWLNKWVLTLKDPRMLSYSKRTTAPADRIDKKLPGSDFNLKTLFEIQHAEAVQGSRRNTAKVQITERTVEMYMEGRESGPVRARIGWESGGQLVTVSMASEEWNYDIMLAFTVWLDKILPAPRARPDEITVGFRYQAGGEIAHVTRMIEACEWKDIRRNYATGAQNNLDKLFARTAEDFASGGKIGLLHGPPGTGKTHLIRALAKEWHDWANIQYIIDVDRFFDSAAYMMDILMNGGEEQWNVIICEDAEEYIGPDAKSKTGQALSRLLNVGDGLVGQGLKILFLFTTNAPAEKLHPAIIRDGRCFANYNIPLLSSAQASEWLESPVSDEISLATLYARKDDTGRLDNKAEPVASPGQFL